MKDGMRGFSLAVEALYGRSGQTRIKRFASDTLRRFDSPSAYSCSKKPTRNRQNVPFGRYGTINSIMKYAYVTRLVSHVHFFYAQKRNCTIPHTGHAAQDNAGLLLRARDFALLSLFSPLCFYLLRGCSTGARPPPLRRSGSLH